MRARVAAAPVLDVAERHAVGDAAACHRVVEVCEVQPSDIDAVDEDIQACALSAGRGTGSPAVAEAPRCRSDLQLDWCAFGGVQIGCPVTASRRVVHGGVAGVGVGVGRADRGVIRPLAREWHADESLVTCVGARWRCQGRGRQTKSEEHRQSRENC